ncbi:MAG TPA: ornithine carbamoyltransferase [Baekduia sp.]|uniref:ornithine carbamoyltransferase n=1 Tax=Baekduia sp. TaxID=2600305 RepID=UPI002D771580|nr:ornithine carbamoyltransferase [Baekduia sp.]HET6509172.1 ornithine carbamoyltransferase [Baekduia sp.]
MSTVVDLRGRHLLTLDDYTAAEIVHLIDLAAELKAARRDGREVPRLEGREIAFVFEQDAPHARCALEVAARDQGAHVTLLGPGGARLGRDESVKDTARVLGRLYDAIEYRGFAEAIADELARWAGVPVYNGLTGEWHPAQVLADFLTLREHVRKPWSEIALCYLGDARFTIADTYVAGAGKLAMDIRIAAPESLWPSPAVLDRARAHAAQGGGTVLITEDVEEAVAGCDALIADAWVAPGELPEVWAERIALLRPYQVNADVMALTGNPDVKFLHGLPASHNTDTARGQEILDAHGVEALEVTEEVFESPASVVFDAAENRMHAIKAVLVATLGA